MLVISLALLGAFIAVFLASQYKAQVAGKYPPVDCAPYMNYGDSLESFAILDYNYNLGLEAKNEKTAYSGYLTCFCDQQKADSIPST